MKTFNLCFLGFGNVGRALLRLLGEKSAEMREAYGIEWRVTGVATRLLGFRGLFNSTTNIILEEIEAGRTFDEGVARAQQLGVTETDPTYDVDGWDSAGKGWGAGEVFFGG